MESSVMYMLCRFFLSILENGVGQTIQRSKIPKDKERMYQEKDAV